MDELYGDIIRLIEEQGGCNDPWFWQQPACLDYISVTSQDLATMFSTTGALATTVTTIIGCVAGTEAGVIPGCAGGYVAGVGFHIAVTNPIESWLGVISTAATIRSDYLKQGGSIRGWHLGEDAKTSVTTFILGSVSTEPFVDAATDIYASGYNHGFFCGFSTFLDCLP